MVSDVLEVDGGMLQVGDKTASCSKARVEEAVRSEARVEAAARSEARVEAMACSEIRDNAVACSRVEIKDGRRW
jgi:hypothetical protein